MRTIRFLLNCGIAVPIFYFLSLMVAAAFFPGYSHVTQYASELGGPDAVKPAIFNTGIVATGAAGVLAGAGYFLALRRLASARVPAALAGLAVSLWGIAVILAGVYPMPDDRHGGYGLGLGLQIAPLLVFWGLRGTSDARRLRALLLLLFVAMSVMFAVMMGVGGLVTRANVGLWQRGNVFASIPWIGLVAYALRQRLAAVAPGREPA